MTVSVEVLVIICWTVASCSSKELLVSLGTEDITGILACSQGNVISCVKAEVEVEVLQEDDIELPGGTTLHIKTRGPNSAVFQDDLGQEAIFAWQGSEIAGQVHLLEKSWSLESCGEACGWQHVWVEQGRDFVEEETEELGDEDLDRSIDSRLKAWLYKLGEEDTTTIVTYSVMFWYTQDFKTLFATEAALNLFIDIIIEETNNGYNNSKIPVRVKKHCVKQHPTLNDIYDSSTMLTRFKDSMSLANLKNSADAAALLVANFSSCGRGYTHTASNCFTLSVTMKQCATGYYSFGHEVGHNFGGKHNPEQYSNASLTSHPYLHGHAHLIQPTGSEQNSGYRTILAYNAFGHRYRKNYYSNPDVIFPITGTPTGVLPLSNNAKVISDNRFAMAACGDESNTCNAISTTMPITTTEQIKPTTEPGCFNSDACAKAFGEGTLGICVSTTKKGWNLMYKDIDFSAPMKTGLCGSECGCGCFKEKKCMDKKCVPIPKKKIHRECIKDGTAADPNLFNTGRRCAKRKDCHCYQNCKNSKRCTRAGGKCLGSAPVWPHKDKGACDKKNKCKCYVHYVG